MLKKIFFILIASVAFAAYAQDGDNSKAEKFLASLKMQSGTIKLPGDIATLNLTEKFRYLSPEDTEHLLVDGWGNPPGNKTLGMIVSTDSSPLSSNGWGVIITYNEDGYVSDADADKIDYNKLLADMKEQSKAANEERVKKGYGSMLLTGWAEAPRYDKQARKLFWAKQYSTDKNGEDSLNYNIRVLGRKGVLVLNAIAGINQLNQIKNEIPNILAMTEFTKGNRYEDFDSKTDHIAEYGLAALVAGGVAAKLGLFAKLFAMLIAFKKIIIIGFIAVGAFIKKLFTRK